MDFQVLNKGNNAGILLNWDTNLKKIRHFLLDNHIKDKRILAILNQIKDSDGNSGKTLFCVR